MVSNLITSEKQKGETLVNPFALEVIRFYGIPEGTFAYDVATYLINSEDDMELLHSLVVGHGLDGHKFALLAALNDLRMNRMPSISKDDFMSAFNEDPKQAIENLFQQHIKESYIQCMKEKGVTPERVFDYHTENPEFRFEWLVL
ncbi:hypothetical protein [Tuberibacillus calidus]|uniref:hypothetical protein n=1 Tax=Tuberibacillus calidus TaxID=340097 RepID=UPI00041197C5|nr:hypothetical protein [Tuberibacillus calidus]